MTGKELWNYETAGIIAGSPAVTSDMIIIGSGDGMLYAFGNRSR
jgi:outer membrane protein assembly factor BamB